MSPCIFIVLLVVAALQALARNQEENVVTVSSNDGSVRLCGKNLVDALELLCKGRVHAPTEEQLASPGGIATACCVNKCTWAYLAQFCRAPTSKAHGSGAGSGSSSDSGAGVGSAAAGSGADEEPLPRVAPAREQQHHHARVQRARSYRAISF